MTEVVKNNLEKIEGREEKLTILKVRVLFHMFHMCTRRVCMLDVERILVRSPIIYQLFLIKPWGLVSNSRNENINYS